MTRKRSSRPKVRVPDKQGFYSAVVWDLPQRPSSWEEAATIISNEAKALLDSPREHWVDTIQTVIDHCFEDAGSEALSDSLAKAVRVLRVALVQLSIKLDVVPKDFFLNDVVCLHEEPVASGGFAVIFGGTWQHREFVALKVLRALQNQPTGLAATQEDHRRYNRWMRDFYSECLLLKNLRHPNVLRVFGVSDKARPTISMVMPWMNNGHVLKYMSRISDAVDMDKYLVHAVHGWMYNIISGLEYLASEGIVHGDLRAANILIEEDQTAMLADFGFSVLEDRVSKGSYTSLRGGATWWLSPELLDPESFDLQDSRPTLQSDIYSFACVCHELYSRVPPFSECRTEFQVFKLVCEKQKRPERPNFFLTGEPMEDPIWEMVQKCWAHLPSERASAAEARSMIAAHLIEHECRPKQWQYTRGRR